MATEEEILIDISYTSNLNEAITELRKLVVQLKETNSLSDKTTKASNRQSKSQKENAKTVRKEREEYEALTKVKGGLLNLTRRLVREVGGLGNVFKLGIGFSISNLIGDSHALNQQLSSMADELAQLSGSSGNAYAAVNDVYDVFGKTLVSTGKITAAMKDLNDIGIPLGGTMKELAALSGNLSQMTGLAVNSWSKFTGTLSFSFKATTADIRELSSSMIGTGLSGEKLTAVMNVANNALKDLVFLTKDGISGVKGLVKSIGTASAVFDKLGVSSQTASEFIGNFLDPGKFEQNIELMGRLGISQEDFFKSLESGAGRENLIDKMLQNLPQLSKQIQAIPNPMARFNFAKQIGMPMELAAKMANATGNEIEDMMNEFKGAQSKDKALKKKEASAKEEAARFQERLDLLKRQALEPLMKFVSYLTKAGGPLFKIVGALSQSLNRVFAGGIDKLGPTMEKLINGFVSFTQNMFSIGEKIFTGDFREAGNLMGKSLASTLKNLLPKVLDFGIGMFKALTPVVKDIFWMAGKAFIDALMASPLLTTIGTLIAVNKIKKSKTVATLKNFAGSTKGKKIGGVLGRAGKIVSAPVKMATGGISNAAAQLQRVTKLASKFGGSLLKLGVKGLPIIGTVISATMGAAEAFGKAKDFFTPNAQELTRMKDLRLLKKIGLQLTKDELRELDKLQDRQAGITTDFEKMSSGLAGGLSLGILPMIDSFFQTDLTGAFARGIAHVLGPFEDIINQIGIRIKVLTVNARIWLDPIFDSIGRIPKMWDNTMEMIGNLFSNFMKRIKDLMPDWLKSRIGIPEFLKSDSVLGKNKESSVSAFKRLADQLSGAGSLKQLQSFEKNIAAFKAKDSEYLKNLTDPKEKANMEKFLAKLADDLKDTAANRKEMLKLLDTGNKEKVKQTTVLNGIKKNGDKEPEPLKKAEEIDFSVFTAFGALKQITYS